MRQIVPGGGVPELTDEDLECLYLAPDRRHLRLDFVTTLDGAVEVDGRSGNLGGNDDRRVFFALRAVADVVLIGSGTLEVEDYGPARLAAGRRERRRQRGQPDIPPIAVVSTGASIDPGARLFVERREGDGVLPRPIVVCAASAPPDRRDALAAVADVEVCGDEHIDLSLALDRLAARGLRRVLCEGGPRLTRSLLDEGLVDELCLTLADVLGGPGRLQLLRGGPFAKPVPLRLAHLLAGDGMLAGRWEIER